MMLKGRFSLTQKGNHAIVFSEKLSSIKIKHSPSSET